VWIFNFYHLFRLILWILHMLWSIVLLYCWNDFYALGCMQATFFTTYILSSGWASLAVEVMQIFPLLRNLFQRFILRLKEDALDGSLSFPYHTEVPRILLFGFLGFTCAILAPLMLPFLLVYFFIAYLVYRNQVSKSIMYLSCIFLIMEFIAFNYFLYA